MGFLVVLALLGTLIYVWNGNIKNKEQALNRVLLEQERSRWVAAMLTAGHRQSLALLQMAKAETPSDRDVERRNFQDAAETFARIREQFLAEPQSDAESAAWETAERTLKTMGTFQQRAMELIYRDEPARALDVLAQQLGPVQAQFTHQLSVLLNNQESFLRGEIDWATAQNRGTYLLLSLLGAAAILWGGLTVLVIQRNSVAEPQLLEQGDRIRALYEVSMQPGLSVEQQVNKILETGCRMLDLDMGKVCSIDESTQTNTFVYAVGLNGAKIEPGTVLPLEKTFCSIPFRSSRAIAISHVKESEYSTYPCYEFSYLESYIAAPIWVNGVKHGTINFASRLPRAKPFQQTDIDLVNLIGNWIAVVLERHDAAKLRFEKRLVEEANEAKSACLANMSRELRAPLNAIIGYTELLEEELSNRSEKVVYVKDVSRIKDAAAHLLALVNGILDLSRLEAGSMEVRCEAFAVRRILDEVTVMIAPMMERNGNRLRVSCEEGFAMMHSDPRRLKQVLFNLASSAAEHTRDGTVSLRACRDGDLAIFEIADTSAGMSEQQVSDIFQSFGATSDEGAGLGMSISQRVCQLLGGKIAVTSRLGEGTCFRITLPTAHNVVAQMSA